MSSNSDLCFQSCQVTLDISRSPIDGAPGNIQVNLTVLWSLSLQCLMQYSIIMDDVMISLGCVHCWYFHNWTSMKYLLFMFVKIMHIDNLVTDVNQNTSLILGLCPATERWLVSSQWEMALLCNDVFHWLGASPREPHTLAWGSSSSHTKIFRVEPARLKTREKITESL